MAAQGSLFAQIQNRPQIARRVSTGPIVKRIAVATPASPVLTSHATTVEGDRPNITIGVDLGEPIASNGNVLWPRLSSATSGMMIEHRGNLSLLAITFSVPADASNLSATVLQATRRTIPGITTQPSDFRTTVSRPITFRSLRTVTVRFPLVSGNSALTKFRLSLAFASRSQRSPSGVRDVWFEGLNKHLVVNRWDLDRFRIAAKPVSARPFATASLKPVHPAGKMRPMDAFQPTTFQWIDTLADYVKLSVTRDGMYRVKASDVSSFNLAQHGFNASNIRCINHGVEIPLWIDSDASGKIVAIEFYGQHLHGEPLSGIPEYYNLTSDTNAYWLTISSKTRGVPLRYKQVTAGLPSQTFTTGTTVLHHERDFFYYIGDAHFGQDEVFQHPSTYTPGERFEWFELHSPFVDTLHLSLLDTFYIASLPSSVQSLAAHVQILAHGMTAGDHRIKIKINNSIIYDAVITDFNDDTSRLVFQASKLREGLNTFEVSTEAGSQQLDEFYFDHYDLTFEGGLARGIDTGSTKNQWRFSLQPSASPYAVSLSNAGDAQLLNLSDTTVLLSQGGIFIDSTSTTRPEYAAATSTSLLSCDRIEAFGRNAWRILSPNNRADYIIITHPEFLLQAQLLAARRSKAGMASLVVTTDELYNAFNFGEMEPDALRRFLSYAYFFYSGQQNYPVGYVTLFGAGTWDPKFNLNNLFQDQSTRTKYRTFVPTYGWPTSDFYYTLAEDGGLDTIQPRMVIARIPVRTIVEADGYLRKIQEYEDAAPAEWNRRFEFLMGGSGTSQHQQFMDQVHRYMEDPVALATPPTNIRYKTIERDPKLVQDPNNSTPDPSHVGEIQGDIERGLGMLYFGGHGATFISDILFPDVQNLHNRALYPFLFTVSCRTGAFGEPNEPTINASYVQRPEAGSAFAYGTTGFGELDYDGRLSEKFFWLMRYWRVDSTLQYNRVEHDTSVPNQMNLTAMLTAAKLYASDTAWVGPTAENLRLQYSALGDAAIGFALRPQPELSVHANDITTFASDSIPRTLFSVSDSTMNVSVLVHNYGYAAEKPVVVRIQDIPVSGSTSTVFDTLSRLDDSARINVQFHLSEQAIGEHTVAVSIDPDRNYRRLETDTLDDDASTNVLVNGLAATPFYPWEGARNVCDVSGDRVHFIVLFPQRVASRVQLQVDTTSSFLSPLIVRDTLAGSRYYGTFDVSLSALPKPSTSIFWWRTRIIRSRGDTSAWQYASFSVASAARSEFSYSSFDQFHPTILSGLAANPTQGLFLPLRDTVRYDIIAHGSEDSALPKYVTYSNLYVNGRLVENYEQKIGYVIATLTADRSTVDSVWEVTLDPAKGGDSSYSVQTAMLIDSIITQIPDSTVTIFFTGWQPAQPYFTFGPTGGPSLTQAALQKLGSKKGMDGIQFFGSYALVGKKGWQPGMGREVFAADKSNGARLSDTEVTSGTFGTSIMPFTAVARAYGNLRASSLTPTGSDIAIIVLGAKRDGSGTDKIATLHTKDTNSLDLSKTDPRVYDRLGLRMEFSRQTNAAQSPELHGVELEYDAAPEFIFANDTVLTQPSSVTQGSDVIASYSVETLTCDSALNVVTQLTGSKIAANDTITRTIAKLVGHSTISISDTIHTISQLGRIGLAATVNPREAQNEQLLFNNTATGAYTVGRDTTKPSAEILLSGTHVSPCGFVSDTATTTVNLISANMLRATDSNSIKVTLQGDTSYFAEISPSKPQGFVVRFVPEASGPIQALLDVSPAPGYHFGKGQWNVMATIKDASGNVDTVRQCFTISATNGLEHVMNYPNPFTDKTFFTFELRSDAPSDVKIIVYTVAGRKLRTLVPTRLRAGFNMVEWDGRDEKGNAVGNGTYLYRVVMNGKNPDGSDASGAVTEKAVRSR